MGRRRPGLQQEAGAAGAAEAQHVPGADLLERGVGGGADDEHLIAGFGVGAATGGGADVIGDRAVGRSPGRLPQGVTVSPSRSTAQVERPTSPPVVISVVADASSDSSRAMAAVSSAIGPAVPWWASVRAWVWCIANTMAAELHAAPMVRATAPKFGDGGGAAAEFLGQAAGHSCAS